MVVSPSDFGARKSRTRSCYGGTWPTAGRCMRYGADWVRGEHARGRRRGGQRWTGGREGVVGRWSAVKARLLSRTRGAWSERRSARQCSPKRESLAGSPSAAPSSTSQPKTKRHIRDAPRVLPFSRVGNSSSSTAPIFQSSHAPALHLSAAALCLDTPSPPQHALLH